MTASVDDRIRTIICEHIDVAEAPGDKTLFDLGADSLDAVEIGMAVEEEFGIEIPDEEMEALDTPGKIIAYVTERV